MKYFYCGTFTMALVIGLLTGVSASPVVTVIIPLLFSAVTAGGAVYTFNSNENISASRKLFLGVNGLLFSSGFIIGLWFGVAAKLNPTSVWPVIEKPAFIYSEIKQVDATMLIALIEIERRMIGVGTSTEKRREVLGKIVESINKRRHEDGTLDSDDRRMLEKVALSQISDSSVPMIPVAKNFPKKDFFDWIDG